MGERVGGTQFGLIGKKAWHFVCILCGVNEGRRFKGELNELKKKRSLKFLGKQRLKGEEYKRIWTQLVLKIRKKSVRVTLFCRQQGEEKINRKDCITKACICKERK